MQRIDAWTNEEDMILVETIIQGVAKGRTQLDLFAEVGEKVRRTASACGFRWNSTVRHQYKDAFDRAMEIRGEAKALRKQHRKKQQERIDIPIRYEDSNFDAEWDALTFKDNTQDAVILPQSRIQSQIVQAKVYSLTGLTEAELQELDKILDIADSEILLGLRYDIKATLSR